MSNLNSTVFVVDQDPSVRSSLESVIRRAGWNPVSFETVVEFLAQPTLPGPCCLLMELDYTELAGFDLLRELGGDPNAMPFIVMSSRVDVPLTVQAMKAGATEFLLKPLAEDVVQLAVSHAIARSYSQLQQRTEMLALRHRHDSLSLREREVMAWVVAGLLNKQVGAELGISEITVKAHRGRVMRKMGADSLAELVSFSLRLNLPVVRSTRMSRFKPRTDIFARETELLAGVG